MLSEKPWKPEAVLRLFLGVVVCVLVGAAVSNAVRFQGGAGRVDTRVFFALVAAVLAFLGGVLFLIRKPWPLEHFSRYFMGLLGCLYAGLTLGYFVQHFSGDPAADNLTWRTVAMALSFQGAALVLIRRFVREHEMRFSDAFGFPVNWKVAVLCGLVLACVFLPVSQWAQMGSVKIMFWLDWKQEVQPAVQALEGTTTWAGYLALGIITIGLAPVAEEMLFRGILYPAIKRLGRPHIALWGTSVLFAAVHSNVMSFAPLLLLALALTVLYEKTGNLLAPIAAHSLFNALNFLIFCFEQQSGLPG